MNFTIKQLRAFATVADLQSFHLAAQRLNLTAGAVSLIIRDLEGVLGFTLFDRTTRRVSLSKEGHEFLPAAQQALRHIQGAAMAAQAVRNRSIGVIRVAAPLIVAHAMLPPAIAEFRRHHPQIMVRPVDCTVEALVRMVAADHADLSLGPDRPTPDGVERISLYESPWVLWLAADHPLAGQDRITWAMLKNESVIAAGGDYESRVAEAMQSMPENERLLPTYVVDNITTSLGMAAAGLGVALSPSYVSVVALPLGLVMRNIEAPRIVREFSLYLPRNRSVTAACSLFVPILTQCLKQAAGRSAGSHAAGGGP